MITSTDCYKKDTKGYKNNLQDRNRVNTKLSQEPKGSTKKEAMEDIDKRCPVDETVSSDHWLLSKASRS
jgi:hypothetical protein